MATVSTPGLRPTHTVRTCLLLLYTRTFPFVLRYPALVLCTALLPPSAPRFHARAYCYAFSSLFLSLSGMTCILQFCGISVEDKSCLVGG